MKLIRILVGIDEYMYQYWLVHNFNDGFWTEHENAMLRYQDYIDEGDIYGYIDSVLDYMRRYFKIEVIEKEAIEDLTIWSSTK